jgi:hypothetical protein
MPSTGSPTTCARLHTSRPCRYFRARSEHRLEFLEFTLWQDGLRTFCTQLTAEHDIFVDGPSAQFRRRI